MEYAGLVDANMLSFIFPLELRQFKILIISGSSDNSMFTYIQSDEINTNLEIYEVIIHCHNSHFTLLKPMREPNTIATKEICQSLLGEWLWKHDGSNTTGKFILHDQGKIT